MFNIGSFEVLLICVIALLVLGPERLPSAVRTAGLWIGRFRRSFYKVKSEIERELNADEIRRQLHNESVMAEIESAKESVETVAKDTQASVNNIVNSANFDPGASKYTDDQVAASALPACSATQHRAELQDDGAERVTVGTVQREIRVGMTSAEVATILGAPNIVSTDAERREVWIWDKISSDVSYSRSSGVVAGLLIGSSGGGAGVGSKNAGASRSSQRTLTVIVKFDDADRVRDFSYRTSSF